MVISVDMFTKSSVMKTVRKWIIVILALFCFIALFSYISGLEEGLKENWMVLVIFGSGGLCYGLCRYWSKRGKLPDDMLNEKNDKA